MSQENYTSPETDNEGGDENEGRKEYTTIGVRPTTKHTVQEIQNITNKKQEDIVDEALAEYLATEVERLADKYDIVDQIEGDSL